MSRSSYSTASTSSAGSFTTSISASSTRRTQAIPSNTGEKALFTVSSQPPGNRAPCVETRILDLRTNTSSVFFNEVGNREAQWLRIDDDVIWLRDSDGGSTEIWIADASERSQESHCAGQILGRAFHLKTKKLHNEHGDIAIAVGCSTDVYGNPCPLPDGRGIMDAENSIFFTTLRRKPYNGKVLDIRYVVSPSKWINALRGSGLASPVSGPHGSANDFDISYSGITFVSKDPDSASSKYPSINTYYIPLKTFTELSKPRPQLIGVPDYEGRSSQPCFSPNGSAVAFLKKKHPIDQNDRSRVIIIGNIREHRAFMPNSNSGQPKNKEWHLSPFSLAWADHGRDLYAVAIDQGIRKLFKIPVTPSSAGREPELVTNDSTSPTDIRQLRMVFSAPMEPRT